jgi:hypothetical protein
LWGPWRCWWLNSGPCACSVNALHWATLPVFSIQLIQNFERKASRKRLSLNS